MNKGIFHIVILYIIGISFIACYFLLENSNVISVIAENSSSSRNSGFVLYIILGALQYGSLLIGLGIILTLSFLLIKEKFLNDS